MPKSSIEVNSAGQAARRDQRERGDDRRDSDEGDDLNDGLPAFRALNQQEAQDLAARQPTASPWRILLVQVLVGLVTAVLLGLLWRSGSVAVSALYGAAVVVLPGCVMALGITSRFSSMNAGTSVVSFMLWETVKIAASVAMLVLAPQIVQPLSWPALLAGLVLCLKCYWVALLWRGSKKS